MAAAAVVRKAAWSAEVEQKLAPVLREYLPAIRDNVESGKNQLWIVNSTLHLVTWMDTQELVIVAAAGTGLREFAPYLYRAAQQAGATTIRFHTKRPALARLLSEWGFKERERVYAMEVQ